MPRPKFLADLDKDSVRPAPLSIGITRRRLSLRVVALRLTLLPTARLEVHPPMMQHMREIAKPVFWVVAISFVGWLAYGQVTEILGGGRDVVLKVNGRVVRNPQFQTAFQGALEEARHQRLGRGGAPDGAQHAASPDPAPGRRRPTVPDERPVRHHEVAALLGERDGGVPRPGRAAVPGLPPGAQAGAISHSRRVRARRQALAHLAGPA